MPARRQTRSRMLGLACLLLLAGRPGLAAAENLLTASDLAALEQENRMWRLLQPEEDVADNLQRLRAAGFGTMDIGRIQPRLEELWTVVAERNYGWLNPDAVEKILEVDREYIPRMRSARLHEAVGIQTGSAPATTVEVNRQWRRAILQVLEHDELAEFRLVNSAAAREIGRLLAGIPLAAGEERRLFQLERDFRTAYAVDPVLGMTSRDPYRREARLDHLAAIRETLGDDRFALYLGRADPEFGEMRLTLARVGAEDVKAALELWRVRQNHAIQRSRPGILTGRTMAELDNATQSAAAAVLGEECFRRYTQEENSRWMFSVRRSPRATTVRSP